VIRLIAALGALFALTGCTVPAVGLTGVGLASDGGIVGYLAVCEEHIDGVTLYIDDQSGLSGQDAGRWSSRVPITASANWSLSGTSQDWITELALQNLRPDQPYALYGWTRDDSSSTASVSFTLRDLQGLKPGQVLFIGGYDEEHDRDIQRVGSFSDMHNLACSNRP
jgi:hypothetical protein